MPVVKKVSYLIIGAGSAGLTAAIGFRKLGKDVLLVSKTIGGDCTHTGCVPSKTFLHLARKYANTSSSSDKKHLHESVFSSIRSKIHQIETHDREQLEKISVPYIDGTATFISKNSVMVQPLTGATASTVQFETCYIATGSSPMVIPIQGLPQEKIITSDTLFELKSLPESLCIIGGGPIGAEMATAFAAFGTKVTMIIRSRLLPNEHPDIVAPVRKALQESGVAVFEDSAETKFDDTSKSLIVTSSSGKKKISVPESSYYLFALGRVPTLPEGLEKAHVNFDKQGIQVNTGYRTSNSNIYAIGDTIPGPKFTHVAYQHAKSVISARILPFFQPPSMIVPAVTFTDPPVASVGTVAETERVQIIALDLAATDRGLIENATPQPALFAIDMLTGKLKGASLTGKAAEELIAFYTVLIQQGISIFKIGSLITPYPTYSNHVNPLYTQFLSRFRTELGTQIRLLLKRNLFRITAAVFWILIATSMFLYLRSNNFTIQQIIVLLFGLLRSPAGILLYFALYSARTFISFSAVVLTVLGGAAYGLWGGIALTLLASNLSSSVAYLLGKTVFSQETNDAPGSLIASLRKNAFETVIIARFTFFPYDLLSYISGAVRIPFISFIVATAIGSIPGTIAFTSFGAGITDISDATTAQLDSSTILFGFVLLVVSLIASSVIKKYKQFKTSTR